MNSPCADHRMISQLGLIVHKMLKRLLFWGDSFLARGEEDPGGGGVVKSVFDITVQRQSFNTKTAA